MTVPPLPSAQRVTPTHLLPIPWVSTSPNVCILLFHTRQHSPSSLTTRPTSMASELHPGPLQRRRCSGTTTLPPFPSRERNVQRQLRRGAHLTRHPTGVTHTVCPDVHSIPVVLIPYLDSQRSPHPHPVLLARGTNAHFATIPLASHGCEAPTSTVLSHSVDTKPRYDAPTLCSPCILAIRFEGRGTNNLNGNRREQPIQYHL